MHELTVGPNDSGQRLDKFLGKALPDLPRSLLYKSVRTKKIKLNRRRAEIDTILCEGDTLQLFLADEFFKKDGDVTDTLAAVTPNISVLYEDENILLLNKPAGVSVHEDEGNRTNNLLVHMQAYLYQRGEYDPRAEQSFAPALCNRIDRNTGGIVIAAKNAEALRIMNEKIKNDELTKTYLCLVHGVPKRASAELRGYLRKDSKNNTVEVRDNEFAGAKQIITRYRVLESYGDSALLEVDLITGRTHQIRAHMAHIGHALIGDGKYGVNREEKAKGYKYQALYAYKLYFKKTDKDDLLSYLEGKTFSLDTDEIWFLKEH